MFKDNEGKLSLLRIIVFIAVCLGCIVTTTGLVGYLLKLPDSIAVLATGQALIALASGAKAWQKTSE